MLKYPFISFLKLIRIENLIIIAATQACMKYVLFSPFNEFSNFTPFLFTVSILSTLFIASAGYIINDYFDVKTDKINRPDTVVIDVTIKRRLAMILHIIFNIIGLLLGFYLALKAHNLKLILIQIISIVLLWFYSTHLKKQLLIGNIVVALLTSTIPLLALVYEYNLLGEMDSITMMFIGSFCKKLAYIVLGYSVFSFLTSLTREIIKDMEDYEGDKQTGCKTMPISWGMITSKVVVFFLIIITIGLLLLSCFKFYKDEQFVFVYYVLGLIILPLIILMVQNLKGKISRDFKTASLVLKFVMLTGIAFTFLINHLSYLV